MEVLFFLIPLSLIFIGLIGAVLYWAIESGQYDDLEKPGHEILLDDDGAPSEAAVSRENSDQA